MRDWVERAEEELENDLIAGMITQDEYNKFMRELHQEAEEAGYYGDEE